MSHVYINHVTRGGDSSYVTSSAVSETYNQTFVTSSSGKCFMRVCTCCHSSNTITEGQKLLQWQRSAWELKLIETLKLGERRNTKATLTVCQPVCTVEPGVGSVSCETHCDSHCWVQLPLPAADNRVFYSHVHMLSWSRYVHTLVNKLISYWLVWHHYKTEKTHQQLQELLPEILLHVLYVVSAGIYRTSTFAQELLVFLPTVPENRRIWKSRFCKTTVEKSRAKRETHIRWKHRETSA